jgi:hypothetical protein
LGLILIAILFTLLGIVIGVSISAEPQKALDAFQAIASLGSFSVAIVTMFIAIIALGTWKKHFDHTEKFKAIINLESEFRILCSSFDTYFSSYIKKIVFCNNPINFSDEEYDYFKKRDLFLRLLGFNNSFLSKNESIILDKGFEEILAVFNSAIKLADSNYNNSVASEFDQDRYEKMKEINTKCVVFENAIRKVRV